MFVVFIFASCVTEQKAKEVDIDQMEIDILNVVLLEVLSEILSDYKEFLPIPILKEADSVYERRVEELNRGLDTIEKIVLISDSMDPIHPRILEHRLKENPKSLFKVFKDSLCPGRKIDLDRLKKIELIKFVKFERHKHRNFPEYTLTQITFERIAFSSDYTEAVLMYNLNFGGCTSYRSREVSLKNDGKKWSIIKTD